MPPPLKKEGENLQLIKRDTNTLLTKQQIITNSSVIITTLVTILGVHAPEGSLNLDSVCCYESVVGGNCEWFVSTTVYLLWMWAFSINYTNEYFHVLAMT